MLQNAAPASTTPTSNYLEQKAGWNIRMVVPTQERLVVSYSLQRFTADFRDLTSWVTEMKALINADELANDVAGAEALLDRHQEHKVTSSAALWNV